MGCEFCSSLPTSPGFGGAIESACNRDSEWDDGGHDLEVSMKRAVANYHSGQRFF